MNKSKLAIAGAGMIGKRHILAIGASPAVELMAIADPFPATGVFAEELGIGHYPNLHSLIQAEKPDGIIISTPTEVHFEPAQLAIEAGVPVLIEKPIMATMDEAAGIVSLSEETGVPVLVGHQRRHYRLVEKARDLIRDGTLGTLVAVAGQWTMRKHQSYYDLDWCKRQTAGPVLTNFIHEIDLLRYLCGDIVSITAETATEVLGFEKEDAAAVVMRFASGALGAFMLSDQATSPWAWELATGENAAFPRSGQNPVRFMGTAAALEFPNLTLWHHDGQMADWNHAMVSENRAEGIEDAYAAQIEHFAAVIAGRAKPLVDARDATESLRAALAVFDAAERGRRIVLTSADAGR